MIETPTQPEQSPEPHFETDSDLALNPDAVASTTLATGETHQILRHRKLQTPVSLTHHQGHCTICRHPEREAIEQAFLHWERPTAIAHEFQLGDRRVVYRHARALGLYQQRAWRCRRSLEFIMEQAESVKATADSVIRAVKAHACIDENGRWTEPVKRTIITHQYAGYPDPAMTRLDQAASLPQCGNGPLSPLATSPGNRQPEPRFVDPVGHSPLQSSLRTGAPASRPRRSSNVRHSTEISRHACREISTANPIPSTKPRKFLGTLLQSLKRKNPTRENPAHEQAAIA